MKSFLLSTLAFRYGTSDARTLSRELPGDWLLWEPGSWKPPANRTLTGISEQIRPRAGEALCILLTARPDGVVLGRSPACDIVINDGTLSSRHCLFRQSESSGWTVEDLGSRNGTQLAGVKLQVGDQRALTSGQQVLAAEVLLTFYGAEGLWRRLTTSQL